MSGGASQRASMAPGHMGPGARMSVAGHSSVAAQRIAAKQAELQALQALRNESARLAQEMNKLSDHVDTLVQGGEAVASVMASWQGVFRAIQIAQASTSATRESERHTDTHEGAEAEPAVPLEQRSRQVPDTLVRIPVHAPPSDGR